MVVSRQRIFIDNVYETRMLTVGSSLVWASNVFVVNSKQQNQHIKITQSFSRVFTICIVTFFMNKIIKHTSHNNNRNINILS